MKGLNSLESLAAMLSLLLFAWLPVAGRAADAAATAATQCGCDYTVPADTLETDAAALGLGPGAVICLAAQNHYSIMRWDHLNGSADAPITVRNCGGTAVVEAEGGQYGVLVGHSKYFRIVGDGDPAVPYGIRISTDSGFFLTLQDFSTNFEVAHVEIAGRMPYGIGTGAGASVGAGFAGIGIKTNPLCDHSADRDVFNVYDVSVHDNYVHDTGAEGMYIGYGYYDGRVEAECAGDAGVTPTIAHAIRGLRVYNNLVERTGYDGIQVKNADEDAQIHGNVIIDYGNRGDSDQNKGMLVGDGSEADVYGNYVQDGGGSGIQANFFGNSRVYNNVVVDSGSYGLYFNNTNGEISKAKGGTVVIANNTFVNAPRGAFAAYSEALAIQVMDNAFVGTGSASVTAQADSKQPQPTLTGNLAIAAIADAGFVDAPNHNYALLAESPLVDAGSGAAATVVTRDFNGQLREDGAADVGALEFAERAGNLLLKLSAAVAVSETDGTNDASTLIDEPELAGDPLGGTGGDPVSYFHSTSGQQPIAATIDLGTVQHLGAICYYDRNGSDDFTLQVDQAGAWTTLVSDALDRYQQWKCLPSDTVTRYLRVTLALGQARMPELVLYGRPM